VQSLVVVSVFRMMVRRHVTGYWYPASRDNPVVAFYKLSIDSLDILSFEMRPNCLETSGMNHRVR